MVALPAAEPEQGDDVRGGGDASVLCAVADSVGAITVLDAVDAGGGAPGVGELGAIVGGAQETLA